MVGPRLIAAHRRPPPPQVLHIPAIRLRLHIVDRIQPQIELLHGQRPGIGNLSEPMLNAAAAVEAVRLLLYELVIASPVDGFGSGFSASASSSGASLTLHNSAASSINCMPSSESAYPRISSAAA